MPRNDNSPRVVVWEPYSTYIALNALTLAPFIIPAVMWILAYFQPTAFNSTHVANAVARIWFYSNTLVDRYALIPYYNHSSFVLLVLLTLTLIPAAFFYYRTARTQTVFSASLLLVPSFLLSLIPLLVNSLFATANARHTTWWEMTLLFLATFTTLRYWTKKLKRLNPKTRKGASEDD